MQESEYHPMAALEERHWWYRSLRSRVLARLEAEAGRLGRPLEVFDAGCGTSPGSARPAAVMPIRWPWPMPAPRA